MKNNISWVKISRSILNWGWYTEVNVFKLFMHLIIECNYMDKNWRGHIIKRGQLITGREILSTKTGLSVQEVRTALDKLIRTNEVTRETTRQGKNTYTLLTLVNYNKYQSNNEEETSLINQSSTSHTTPDQPQLKKEKKEKKVNNIYTDFLAYQYLKKNHTSILDDWEKQNKKSIPNYNEFLEYFEIKVEEEEIKFTAIKLLGRLKRLKYNWKGVNKTNSFNDQPTIKRKRIG
jgi:hypothetical protein